MNKSKAFVISRIQNGLMSGFPEDKARMANTLNPLTIPIFVKCCDRMQKTTHQDGTVLSNIKYDPDADFDYCTVNYQMNDSTTMFQYDAFIDILDKLLKLGTCDATKVPEEGLKGDYEITYTIGDFVYVGYYDPDNAPEDKKWMSWNQKTALPIKFDIKKL